MPHVRLLDPLVAHDLDAGLYGDMVLRRENSKLSKKNVFCLVGKRWGKRARVLLCMGAETRDGPTNRQRNAQPAAPTQRNHLQHASTARQHLTRQDVPGRQRRF